MLFKNKYYTAMCAAYLLAIPTDAFARHIEAGQVTTTNTSVSPSFTQVTFQAPFDTPPIVTALIGSSETDPADLRIRNVTTTGFEVAPIEAPGTNGTSVSEIVHYVAIEAGVTTLPNGTVIAAGFHDTTSTLTGSGTIGPDVFDTVPFGVTLSANAAVIATIQTINNEQNNIPGTVSVPFMSVGQRFANTTTVQLSLERSETGFPNGTPAAQQIEPVTTNETIGWIAFPRGTLGQIAAVTGQTISWDARVTASNIGGAGANGGNCFNNNYTNNSTPFIASNARVVATKATRNGGDGGWIRRCSLNSTQIGLHIEEDQTLNAERNHVVEEAALLSFSGDFHAILEGELTGRKDVEMVTASEYSIPGNEVRYRLFAESIGNSAIDSGTVVFIDALPDETTLKVSDIDGVGSGPVRFIDGSPSSGLSYDFISLNSTADDVDFSNDGGSTFTYTPTPNGIGVDSAVTHIRITPSGSFVAASGSGLPNFSVEFEAVIQ